MLNGAFEHFKCFLCSTKYFARMCVTLELFTTCYIFVCSLPAGGSRSAVSMIRAKCKYVMIQRQKWQVVVEIG